MYLGQYLLAKKLLLASPGTFTNANIFRKTVHQRILFYIRVILLGSPKREWTSSVARNCDIALENKLGATKGAVNKLNGSVLMNHHKLTPTDAITVNRGESSTAVHVFFFFFSWDENIYAFCICAFSRRNACNECTTHGGLRRITYCRRFSVTLKWCPVKPSHINEW